MFQTTQSLQCLQIYVPSSTSIHNMAQACSRLPSGVNICTVIFHIVSIHQTAQARPRQHSCIPYSKHTPGSTSKFQTARCHQCLHSYLPLNTGIHQTVQAHSKEYGDVCVCTITYQVAQVFPCLHSHSLYNRIITMSS